jgi:hypothetical protein
MASSPTSTFPATRIVRVKGKAQPVGAFFKAASARKLIACFSGPADLAENHSAYLKAKLRGRPKRSR